MSLRLSSLDPNEVRAIKDCRNCNRRRIRCDRSLPKCLKCALRGLECSAYGPRIQWDQGVASRGKLKGKSLPVCETTLSKPRGKPVGRDPTGASALEVSRYVLDDITITTNEYALNIQLSRLPLPEDPRPDWSLKLFRYYDHVVAALMPWVDGPRNGWRTVMIPIAFECPSLLYAILALSAKHHASKSVSESDKEDANDSDFYRDRALRLVADELHAEREDDTVEVPKARAAGVLSTILVLFQLEIVRLDVSFWQVHWNAVRTITQRWSSTTLSIRKDVTTRFLIKEAFVYDVFGSFTAFDDVGYILANATQDDDGELFVDYLRLIQQVTQEERSREGSPQCFVPSPKLHDMGDLYAAFERARDRNLELATKLLRDEDQDNFNTVAHIYHHTGFIYGLQALIDLQKSAPVRQEHLQATLSLLNQVQSREAIQQDLPWPLFIVGTEARESLDVQRLIEKAFQQMMAATGFRNCQPALDFLRRFWTTDHNTCHWISHARREFNEGIRFMVV